MSSPSAPVRIGTRGSALALAQAAIVAESLAQSGVAHEVVVVQTAGDQREPDTAWGEGAFVTAIERALIEGRVDVAVHSAKDIPTDEDPQLTVAAYLRREEARDALVLPEAPPDVPSVGEERGIDDLAAGAVIGTDSPRRTGFLRAHRPDLDVRPLHGNVDTRLRRLDAGEVDGLVLAAAGLIRLGRTDRISQILPVEIVPPAPGQGAICVQIRAADTALHKVVAAIDDLPTRRAVEAERAFLRAAGGGCRAPIGAFAFAADDLLSLLGGFATLDGRTTGLEQISGSADAGPALAKELAARLTARRARLPGAPRVILTRPEEDSPKLVARLAEHGIATLVVPAIEIEPVGPGGDLDRQLSDLAGYDWVVVTSRNGARAISRAAMRLKTKPRVARWAAVGVATARELRAEGLTDVWLPVETSALGIANELPVETGQRILLARGALADDVLSGRLRSRGAEVNEVVAYVTREAPASSRAPLAGAFADGTVDAVIFASPSAVRGLLSLATDDERSAILAVPAICIGPRTAAGARAAGFAVIRESSTREASALAELTAETLHRRKPPEESAGVAT
ncbi:MAG: hydroxymethylbilane synthase [Chloroflexota bacterium]